MNIDGTFLQGFRDDEVDQIDHRRLVRHHLDVVQIPALSRGTLLRIEILDHLLNRHLITLGDLLQYLRARRDKFLHFQAAQQPNVVNHALVARIGCGYSNGSVSDRDRQDSVLFDKFRRQSANGLGRHVELGQASEGMLASALAIDVSLRDWTITLGQIQVIW